MKRLMFFFFFCIASLLSGASPTDVSLVILDFKFNENDGIKVCEVQPLRVSKLSGYYHTHQTNPSYIKDWLGDWFDSFHIPKWAEGKRLGDSKLKQVYHEKFTIISNSRTHLQKNSEVLAHKDVEPADPYDLYAYTGMMYLTSTSLNSTAKLRSNYPSIVFIDDALLPLYGDKLCTNKIFESNLELACFRPKWGVYEKKYMPSLAKKILNEIGSQTVVIKPRNAARGLGVIIVDSDSLDSVLELILKKSKKLKNHSDPSYSYWYSEKNSNFIVEEFISSDPIKMKEKWYDPTYRFIALMYYTNGIAHIEPIDGYAKLPANAVNSSRSLNDRHKSCGAVPYYSSIKPVDYPFIKEEVAKCLYLLYTQLLKNDIDYN